MKKHILTLPGDGVGPEIMTGAKSVLEKIADDFNHEFTFEDGLIGGAAYDASGTPLDDGTLSRAKNADAILLGAVGGPKWDTVEKTLRPEQGLLKIRKELGLFANLRPIKVFDRLIPASPLKETIVGGTDILFVRELTGGLYFGKPSERRDGGNSVVDTLAYTKEEIERIVEYGFQAAKLRGNKLTSVDKANVLESSRMWREIVDEKSAAYPEVEVEHALVDSTAMKLITNPNDFDVVVTENLFGDILSDEASVITGSIGLLPSASLNSSGFGLYEPVHGSAPDIAGKGIVNPLAMILSAAMMLKYSFHLSEEAEAIEAAVDSALKDGIHTSDLDFEGGRTVSTEEMIGTVISYIK
ncbi:3-isopropylmalate dehydrogenase [Lacicoccus alkaliphilus]|uniref:3-isopropylmalate dehydrogenase n=1 Tax=Lacicoccus alkaliphilus DSM 16010 TaxID=1123231 RepID=A0A1M7CL93_9BACL|nr:3-isopropylmalate dehydrogenase [Salinicoccus alkaliphilus]SHL68034.1 3-isopropylmalate dehydrogenase [Salinicoccus alkaliphilus DSM 16010]